MKIYNNKAKRFYSYSINVCQNCDKQFIYMKQPVIKNLQQIVISSYRQKLFCSKECQDFYKNKPEIKQEFSKKVSLGRIKFLKENPDKHPWKNSKKFISVPCEDFKKFLREHNINFIEEFKVLNHKNYSVDIFIPQIKLCIEINGNQHYKNGKLSQYYQERHDNIIKAGFSVVELHYLKVYDSKVRLNIVEQIKNNVNFNNMCLGRPLFKIGKSYFKTHVAIERRLLKYIKFAELVRNSTIDFSKLGWVSEVQSLTGIRYQKISNYMKKQLPEFYFQDKVYKRKN